jgi:hypothetical protein
MLSYPLTLLQASDARELSGIGAGTLRSFSSLLFKVFMQPRFLLGPETVVRGYREQGRNEK